MKLNNCFDQILAIIGNIFDAYSVALFLPDEKSFFLAAGFSLGNELMFGTHINPGQGLVGWVLKEDKPILVNSFDQKNNVLGYYQQGREKDIKAFMAIPMPAGLGVLCLDSKKTYSFNTKDQKILTQFTKLISDLAGDISRYSSGRQKFNFYKALCTIQAMREKQPRWSGFLNSLLVLVSEVTGFEYCFFAVRDEFGAHYFVEGKNKKILQSDNIEKIKFKIGSGLVGWMFKNYQPIFVQERDKDGTAIPLFAKDIPAPEFKTSICIPLVVHKKTRGLLVLADLQSRNVDEGLEQFMMAVADYLALFLENLYLKNRLHFFESKASE